MKILIITKNWLGDILFEIPAIEAIKGRYPEAEIVCLTPPRCRPILEAHPAVSRVIEFDEKGAQRSLAAKISFVFRLRKEKCEHAYFFHRSRTRAFLLMLAGVKQRTGYAAKRNHFLTRAVEEPKNALHHMDYFTELLRAVEIPVPPGASYSFYFSAEDARQASDILSEKGLKDFACFHLGANWEPKRWPVSHFAKLADLAAQKWGIPVVVTGGEGDRPLAEDMRQRARHARVVSLAGETNLGVTAALFHKALFVVSSDSGPMHIASGVGAPVAAIFGPTNPDLTGPRGKGDRIIFKYVPRGYTSPWYGTELPKEGWLSHIQPEEVLAGIAKKGWAEAKSQDRFDPVARKKALSPAGENDRGVLFVTLSNIGDVILTTPVLMNLAARFPGQKITAVVGPRAKGVLEGSRYIHRLVVYDKQAGLFEKLKFLKSLRREKYDWVVDLRNSAIPFLVSCRKRSPVFRKFKQVSVREKHLEILRMMGAEPIVAAPFDFCDEREEKSCLEKLSRKGVPVSSDWILMAPVAASELKTWPLSGFEEVIRGLLRQSSKTILLTGGAREKPMIEPLTALDPARVFNLAGETTLRESAFLISRCALLLANDSSITQLGFEMQRPVAAIFGPTSASKYGRYGPFFQIVQEPISCAPCEASFCRFEHRGCLTELKAEKVLKACLELLNQKSQGGASIYSRALSQ